MLQPASLRSDPLAGILGLGGRFPSEQPAGISGISSIEGNNKARRIAKEIVAKWPENPMGYLLLGSTHYMDFLFGSTKFPQESLEKAMELAKKTLSMDDSISMAHGLMSYIYSQKREFGKAIAEGEQAVALDPNGAIAHEFYASSLLLEDRLQEAISIIQNAIRLNPIGSANAFTMLGGAYALMGRTEDAVSAYRQAILKSPDNIYAHLNLTVNYMRMGRDNEARAEAGEVLRINPKFTVDTVAKVIPFLKDQLVADRYLMICAKQG